jgi:hypothetical protein
MGAMVMLCLATGCIYLEEVNYPPEVTLIPEQEGPYVRGQAIGLRAETSDRNASKDSRITLTWKLTDDRGRPLTSEEASSCTPDVQGCFVPHAVGVVYRMTVTATDDRGAKGSVYRDFTVDNRGPAAVLRVSGKRSANGHYPLHGEIRFSAYDSTDPDADDLCHLGYAYETVSRPLASVKGVFVEGSCAAGDVHPTCAIDAPAWCIRPDAPGNYRVRVTIFDSSGASDWAEEDVEVDPDEAPCLAQLVPLPIERIFVSRSDGTQRFSVNVNDDLDPWPPTDTNAPGYPAFTWSLQTAADQEPVPIPDYVSNQYELDLLSFSAGQEILVRVDLADRVDRSQTLPCAVASPTCPPGSDPLAVEACVQRVTWKLEVY